MAGGIGSRLSPMTKIIPKPLMPVGDMTILRKIIENFYYQGFKDFRIIINYKKDLIKAYMSELDHPYKISLLKEKFTEELQDVCTYLKIVLKVTL